MADALSRLEKNVLKIKGVSDEQLDAMGAAGICSRADFATVADAATLSALVPGLRPGLAEIVMAWGLGRPAPPAALAAGAAAPAAGPVLLAAAPPPGAKPKAAAAIVLDTPEVVCVHCKVKQPKDRKPDDMCVSCGQRPLPVETAAVAARTLS